MALLRSRLLSPCVALCLLALGSACQEPQPTPATPAEATAEAETQADLMTARRAAMVRVVREDGRINDTKVLDAMLAVPREEFVLPEHRDRAYRNRPLPIKEGQTISQPLIVGLMTELLALEPGDRVLEIGTGSGYQAAVLAEITDQVYTVEIVPLLANEVRERLARLGYVDVATLGADGYYGWEEHAPYDAIIVTAAPDHVPQSLVRQLKDGGRMVIPVGPPGATQTLWLIVKEGDQVRRFNKGGVLFVPFTREQR